MEKKNQIKGTMMLFVASIVWGSSFAVQTTAAKYINAFTFNACRSFIAASFLWAVILIKTKGRPEGIKADANSYIAGLICGCVWFVGINLQQAGISSYPSDAAASGRAAFLSSTYVVFVALVSWFKNKKIHPLVLCATVVCVAGMYLLCGSDGISGIYLGDILELGGAIGFTAQIMIIDRFSSSDSIKFSCMQFMACGVLSTICALIFESPSWENILLALLPLCYVSILSSCVGNTLQIIGQKYAPPAIASIVMSLESVFGALAGWAFLNEQLSALEACGCALVFSSVILTQLPDIISLVGKKKRV